MWQMDSHTAVQKHMGREAPVTSFVQREEAGGWGTLCLTGSMQTSPWGWAQLGCSVLCLVISSEAFKGKHFTVLPVFC